MVQNYLESQSSDGQKLADIFPNSVDTSAAFDTNTCMVVSNVQVGC